MESFDFLKTFIDFHKEIYSPVNIPILYTLKTPENKRFSGIFKGKQNGDIGYKWVK